MPDHSGHIKLWRRLLLHPNWLDEKFTRGQAWVDLLLLAEEDDKQDRIRGIPVTVPRGCVRMSHVELAGRWRWSRGKVIRFLDELESKQQIVQHKSNVTTLVEIANYEIYQYDDTANDTANGTPNGQQKDTKRTAEKQQKKSAEPKGPPPCPVQKIVDLYHTILPELPRCIESDGIVANKIKVRWREKKVRQNLEWWRSYFENRVRTSDFLMGRRTTFQATLGWLTGPRNMTKVLNGQYSRNNGGSSPAPTTYGQHLDDERRRKVQMLLELDNEISATENGTPRIDAP